MVKNLNLFAKFFFFHETHIDIDARQCEHLLWWNVGRHVTEELLGALRVKIQENNSRFVFREAIFSGFDENKCI